MKTENVAEPNHVTLYQYSRYIGTASGQPLKIKVNYNSQTFILFSRMNVWGLIGVASADLNSRNAYVFAQMGGGLTAEASLDSDNVMSITFYDSNHNAINIWADIIVLSNKPTELS